MALISRHIRQTSVVSDFDSITSTGQYRQPAGERATGSPSGSSTVILFHEELGFEGRDTVTGSTPVAIQRAYTSSTTTVYHRLKLSSSGWTAWTYNLDRDSYDERYGLYISLATDADVDNGTTKVLALPGLSTSYGTLQWTENTSGVTVTYKQEEPSAQAVTAIVTQTSIGSGAANPVYYSERSLTNGNLVGVFNTLENGEEGYATLKITRSGAYAPYLYELTLTCDYFYRYGLRAKRID
jgi:hypothetical protein